MFRAPPSRSRPGLNREKPGIGKSSVSIGSLLFLIKTSSKINENRRMYRVFADLTPRRLVFNAHFVKNGVKTRVSEGPRDKKRVKYDTLSPPDQKSAIHSPNFLQIW